MEENGSRVQKANVFYGTLHAQDLMEYKNSVKMLRTTHLCVVRKN